MNIYLVRHGETIHNHQGLSEEGRKNAVMAGKMLNKLSAKTILAGDYARARETAEIISYLINSPVTYTLLLRERKKSDEENFHDLKKRVTLILHAIPKQQQPVVIVTHEVTIKLFILMLLLGTHLSAVKFFKYGPSLSIPTCSVTMCEQDSAGDYRFMVWKLNIMPQQYIHL